MSLQLLSQCKKKLMTSVNKIEKCLEMYDSSALQKTFYDSCKCQSVIKDSLDTTATITQNYNKMRQRIKEINQKIKDNFKK